MEITDSPITEFTETGVITKDGKHREFDIVAVCTGYDAITGGLKAMGIRGRNDLGLDKKWKDGVVTNLGMTINGFPNLFMVYGPQGQLPRLNFTIVYWSILKESQRQHPQRSGQYLLKCNANGFLTFLHDNKPKESALSRLTKKLNEHGGRRFLIWQIGPCW